MSGNEFLSIAKEHARENPYLVTVSFRVLCALLLGSLTYWTCGLLGLGEEVMFAVFLLLFAVLELTWHFPKGVARSIGYALCLAGLLGAGLYVVHCAQTHQLQARP
jgi:hypothetical protein